LEQAASTSGALGAELSDAALVGLYRDGAGEFAFGELVRRHQIAIFRLLLTLIGDADRAERATEQTFFDAAKRLHELEEPGRFFPWLAGIARSIAAKLEAERRKSGPAPARPKPAPKNPRAAVKQQVQTVLGELSNDERVALVLADLEGDSYESIGATLGTTAAEAEQMVERARRSFVDRLTEFGDQGSEKSGDGENAPSLPAGTILGGRFRVRELLGKGGMGMVFRATDLETTRDVAIKILLPDAAKDRTLRKRFEREAAIVRKLDHPNFVKFIAYGGESGEPAYVVMEYVDGRALDALLELESRLEPGRALRITRHVLTGLSWAHGAGVVHRDIKPENVMLAPREGDADFAKILDLGIARLLAPDSENKTRITQKGEIFGTPLYMSPEQVRGDDIDGRADLYSLTVMLFELIASRPPFKAKNSMALFAMHLAPPAPSLLDVAPELNVPSALQGLIDRGLAKEPERRFANADEYLASIQALLSEDWSTLERAAASRAEERPAAAAAPRAPTELPGIRARGPRRAEPEPRASGSAPRAVHALSLWRLRRLRPVPTLAFLVVFALVVWGLWWGVARLGQ
jgi:DNA-directed RNA polymerase specialized sigma24 family protein